MTDIKNSKIEELDQEIQKVRQQMNMMGELAVRLYELLSEKAKLEKLQDDLEII